jgi:hypothetical protein
MGGRRLRKADRRSSPRVTRMNQRRRHLSYRTFAIFLAMVASLRADFPAPVTAESPAEATARHIRVAERRKGIAVICHRGASEFAHENTLEAYRATFELGGDGNEIDIRQTSDGVLVCFHDDMLDRLLEGYGDVERHSWSELQQHRFRNPGQFADQCRIPTLVEVLDLHRRYSGLLHLDIKRPGLDRAIAELLTKMDMWNHVAYLNMDNGGVLIRDPRIKLRRYKSSLYADHSEVFPEAIDASLKKPGDDLICDDPRGALIALGRELGPLSDKPVFPKVRPPPLERSPLGEQQAISLLDSNIVSEVAKLGASETKQAMWITERARAADELRTVHGRSPAACTALEAAVRNHSLTHDWMRCGLDSASAMRALIVLHAPNALPVARFTLWRDDPALESVTDPKWNNPRSWTDFRVKSVVFPTLEKLPGAATEQLCRDYLALSDEQARRIGPDQFEAAAKTLLTVNPQTSTALELLRHRLQIVRGRAILECLQHSDGPWALAALKEGAPHALAYRVATKNSKSAQ